MKERIRLNDSNDKTVLITGSTDGIGRATALRFLKEGYNVIVHGRSREKVFRTIDFIKKETNNSNIVPMYGDLRSHSEIIMMIDEISDHFDKIDILINNAGVFRPNKTLTEDGIEETIAVNYIAPFIISNLLLDLLYKAEKGKILNVVSRLHSNSLNLEKLQVEKRYNGIKAYSVSKTCLIMFTYQLARSLEDRGVSVNCLHPGVIDTKLLKAAFDSFGDTPSIGADHVFFAATDPSLDNVSGKYLEDDRITPSNKITYDQGLQKKLWEKTEEIIGLKCNVKNYCKPL